MMETGFLSPVELPSIYLCTNTSDDHKLGGASDHVYKIHIYQIYNKNTQMSVGLN